MTAARHRLCELRAMLRFVSNALMLKDNLETSSSHKPPRIGKTACRGKFCRAVYALLTIKRRRFA
jgi:hypothetical protein